jgi:methionyl-tRNA formyltransferase
MRIGILTTDTTHHYYFIKEVVKSFDIACILLEERLLTAPFATRHVSDDQRDSYERDELLAGQPCVYEDLALTKVVNSSNDPESIEFLNKQKLDIAFVVGTGKLSTSCISNAARHVINFHGGNPEYYRGLDSHLWAMYHKDFENIVVTMHHVDSSLDTGDIISMAKIPLKAKMPIWKLRAANVATCVNMTQAVLKLYDSTGLILSRTQIKAGRYYSFMPLQLKEISIKNFERYTGSL